MGPKEFGVYLRELREKRGMTLNQLALYSGVSASLISRVENGQRGTPKPDSLVKLAKALNVPFDHLLWKAGIIREVEREEPEWTLNSSMRWIPIVAEIPCGEPVLTESRFIGAIPVDTSVFNLNGGEYVWLRAKGDSMINVNIADGTYVLIRLQPEVENGEIAAVSVDEENATLKRVFFQDGQVSLKPENDKLAPWSYESSRIRIIGKAVMITTYLIKR